ncbi:hypothetical protein [Roseiconus lacunae]|uniref:Uncharacterized protein n=1 Tax=Roseiconus lacunae TaxID=2605694 RepID=A0ABT7PSS9_9BACT|nr:hypothetical protein [Roseiconus lacunae]MDM4019559.1 hypothetical protein [Roseiconus lacunae]
MPESRWTNKDFDNAASAFRSRWRDALAALNVSTIRLCDLVRLADPEFRCDWDAVECLPNLESKLQRFHERFLAYPATSDLDSPYRCLSDILAHGGVIYGEHGIIDIHSSDGTVIGGFSMRSLASVKTDPPKSG